MYTNKKRSIDYLFNAKENVYDINAYYEKMNDLIKHIFY